MPEKPKEVKTLNYVDAKSDVEEETKEEMIVIHFLPHTSLEVGGFGSTKETYENYVKKILEDVIIKLT